MDYSTTAGNAGFHGMPAWANVYLLVEAKASNLVTAPDFGNAYEVAADQSALVDS